MRLLLLATALGLSLSLPAEADYYRYKNKEGNTVITYTLTKEAIAAGYDIINSQGMIVKSVTPASATSDFNAARAQREKDILLLSTYGSIAEFEASIERAEKEYQNELTNLQNKINEAKELVVIAEDKAGKEERTRGKPSERTLATLESANAMLAQRNKRLAEHKKNWKLEQESNKAQLERFTTLLKR